MVDGALVARGLGLTSAGLRQWMAYHKIPVLLERGTFCHGDRRMRVVLDQRYSPDPILLGHTEHVKSPGIRRARLGNATVRSFPAQGAPCLASALLAWTLLLACGPVLAQSATTDATITQLRELRGSGNTSADAVVRLRRIEAGIAPNAPYPLQRELIRTRLVVLREAMDFDKTLAMMQSLRTLAQAHDDTDTVHLMDIDRIYMSHADDDIDKFIRQLNEVLARLTPDASPEVMEALERSYGNMYFDAGNFDTALRHELAALDWADRLPTGRHRARLYRLSTIAELYNAMDLPEQTLDIVDRAFGDNADDIPVQNRISLLAARSMALMKQGRLKESGTALAQAETLGRQAPTDFTSMRLDTLRAELLLAMSRPGDATKAIDRLETLAKEKKNTFYVAKSRMLRGEALMQLDRIDEGFSLMQEASKYFESKGQMIDLLAGIDRQIGTLRDKRLYPRAVTLMEQRQELWSQLFRNERGRAIAEVEARHTAQVLQQEVDTLAADNRVQQERLRAEKLGKALAAALALLAISLSAVLFFATRRARSERDTLSEAVRFDALTGAFSRYQFQRRFGTAGGDDSQATASVGLLLLDLDNFKAINDQYGHEAGDAVLKVVVGRIRQVLTVNDEIYRWGGEEFLVVLNDTDSNTNAGTVGRILSQIERPPVSWLGQALPVSVSGGFVQHPLAPDWEAPMVDAIRWVDAALYLAKNAGRRRVEQVRLTDSGRSGLKGRRPIDMAQLLDWQRHGYVALDTLST